MRLQVGADLVAGITTARDLAGWIKAKCGAKAQRRAPAVLAIPRLDLRQ